MTDNPFRLPRHTLPSRYDLVLEPDLAAASFSGSVVVTLDVQQPSTHLVCNAAELSVDEAWVEAPDGTRVDVAAALDDETERLELTLASEVVGVCSLHLAFRGTLNDKLRGWYRSTYTDDDGTTHVIAASQMQATDCRRAFPCWDEPDFKAVFAVTLVVEPELLAISNGDEVERTPVGDKVAVRFSDTMAMSTYLVAFVVGRLEATPPVDVDGVPLRVVHVPGKAALTAFALEVGAFSLRWFQTYYGIPYPERKVDLVALPDFAAGAMENVGCITFREQLLLVDPATATQTELQRIADVVSHELAHMWFGDLVTMRWWNGIWLNEAFATFMEVAACDAFRPAWRRWESFSLERSAAFDVDALEATRPIEFEVCSPDDADGMFDVLTYEKGGALLRMLQQYLGEDRFQAGVSHYLRTHAYGNTETSDLWDALEETSGEPVRRVMDTWIWQGGHPVVTASVEGGRIRLVQQRFLFSGETDDRSWLVPVHVRQMAGEAIDERWVLLDEHGASVELVDPDATVVVNAGAHGFYRVRYDATLLRRLHGPALSALTTPERYALVDDAWAAVVAGTLGADEFCHFVRAFGDEHELAVWQAVVQGLRTCDRLADGPERDDLRAFVRALVGPALQRRGWTPTEDEDALARQLRGLLVGAVCVLGNDPDAIARAHEIHQQVLADPSSVDAEVGAAVVGVVAATGTEADHDVFVERFRHAPTPQEQLRYLYALGSFPDAALMKRTLEFVMGSEVKTQNAPFVLATCMSNRDLGEQAWRFVREHWQEANDRFAEVSIIRMVSTVPLLSRPHVQADVAAFFAEHPIPQAAKVLEQLLERQRINVGLRARVETELPRAFTG